MKQRNKSLKTFWIEVSALVFSSAFWHFADLGLKLNHILSCVLLIDIQWDLADEPLSSNAIDAVEQLLTMDPNMRPTSKDVRQMVFFNTIDWDNLPSTEPPFVPQPENPTDTGYFEPRNIMQHLKLSNIDIGEFVRDCANGIWNLCADAYFASILPN